MPSIDQRLMEAERANDFPTVYALLRKAGQFDVLFMQAIRGSEATRTRLGWDLQEFKKTTRHGELDWVTQTFQDHEGRRINVEYHGGRLYRFGVWEEWEPVRGLKMK